MSSSPSPPFELDRDATALAKMLRADAPPEVIAFYAARILEGLTASVVERFTGRRTTHAAVSIAVLRFHALALPAEIACFHALRHLGNAARHIHRRLDEVDRVLVLALLDRLLAWRLVSAEGAREILRPFRPSGVEVDTLDALFVDPARLRDRSGRVPDRLFTSPLFAAIYAERLLEAGHADEALAALERARANLPEDLRLIQLESLALRRSDPARAKEAVALLEGLSADGREDFETFGLLGGAYKTLFTLAPEDLAPLRKAAEVYRHGWERSGGADSYLGINSASARLLVGDHHGARTIAHRIVRAYEKRPAHAPRYSGYWDRVTHAEALLHVGEIARARAGFARAFALYELQRGSVGTTRRQLGSLLRALELGDVDAFLERSLPEIGRRPLRLAVVGDASDEAIDRSHARALLTTLCASRELALYTRLRPGLDRALVEIAVELGVPHVAVLPKRDPSRWIASTPDPVGASRSLRTASRVVAERELGGPRSRGVSSQRILTQACDAVVFAGPRIEALPPSMPSYSLSTPLSSEPRKSSHEVPMYEPKPIDVSDQRLPDDLTELAESLAENVHEVWAALRIEDGWRLGETRDDASKRHPGLVPYQALSESEKRYDREMVIRTLLTIQKLGYRVAITPHDP